MSEKKIGTCVKVLINVGNYQNVEVAKYAETTISYSTKDEMILPLQTTIDPLYLHGFS